ncbi:MAG TPA: hypothetical protein VLD16_12540 [Gaiellaceae bacterium]|nr:hypothetical protein [Gaiellaceae bacterium]
MKKALLVGLVAVAAIGGLVAAMVLSSRGGGDSQASPTTASTPPGTTGTTQSPTTTAATTTAPPTTLPTTPDAPIPTRPVKLPPPPSSHSVKRGSFVVGTVDDSLAQQSPQFAQAQVDNSRDAGFDAAIVSATWRRGQRRPPASAVAVLRNVARATARDHMQLMLVVWHGLAAETPRSPSERADFAAYAAALVKALPQVTAVIVGNEPNLSTFWKPQFGAGGSDAAARAYEDLLARSYDSVKAARPGLLVLGGALSPRGADRPGGSRPTHSPTRFLYDLGVAYRGSGRTRPLMDAFAIHPYMQASRDTPAGAHPNNTTITLADYPKLVRLLDAAFRGTAQEAAHLPIYYTEFGVQTPVPAPKRRFYSDLASAASTDTVPYATQAAYYRRALELAYCQPTVRGLFVFHTFDEASLNGWQSGLYFADRTPKPSLPAFKRAVADLRNGRFPACRGG